MSNVSRASGLNGQRFRDNGKKVRNNKREREFLNFLDKLKTLDRDLDKENNNKVGSN